LVAFAVAILLSSATGEVEGVQDNDAEARADNKAVDDDGATVEFFQNGAQLPNPDRQPSPQKSGPDPQYSNWLQQGPPANSEPSQV
jgi:hypothetical protein